MNQAFQIVVVEDDNILREELMQFLCLNEFSVFEANCLAGLNDILITKKIDLVLLDINLPGQNGLEIAQKIRQTNPHIGIVMLTARTSPDDKIKGYEAGADIYLTKPSKPIEILAAIKSLKRRILQTDSSAWMLDSRRRILINSLGIEIDLTATETQLMLAFNNSADRILETGIICDIVSEKNHGNEITRRSVENIISRLRKKLSASNAEFVDKNIIRSIWKHGYQLCILTIVI